MSDLCQLARQLGFQCRKKNAALDVYPKVCLLCLIPIVTQIMRVPKLACFFEALEMFGDWLGLVFIFCRRLFFPVVMFIYVASFLGRRNLLECSKRL